jgi:hypothetical protein
MGDRDYSLKELEHMSIDLGRRGVKDELFQRYFWAYSRHPEYQPDYLSILRLAIPRVAVHGELNLKTMSQLDDAARARSQRILQTIEDAAKDFHDFYENVLTNPLAQDLERNETRRRLMTYFEHEEIVRVPDIRTHSEEEVEEGGRTIAFELLKWLRTVTRVKILNDIKVTLDRHYAEGQESANLHQTCTYKSHYVKLSANRSEERDGAVTTLLTPARGHGAVKEGYAGVYFPAFRVQIRKP